MSVADQPAPRPYRAPSLSTAVPTRTVAVLLACTGRLDCEPIVGFPCCKRVEQGCNGCKPP